MRYGRCESNTGDGTGIHHMKNPNDAIMMAQKDITWKIQMMEQMGQKDITWKIRVMVQKDITWKIQMMEQMLFAMSVHHAQFEKQNGHGTSRPF